MKKEKKLAVSENRIRTNSFLEQSTQLISACSKSAIETLKNGCEICSKLTIETPKRRHFGGFIVNFEHISHLSLVFLLLTLSK